MAEGRLGQRMEMAVMIPIVPSDPINNCFKSKPMDQLDPSITLILTGIILPQLA